MQYKDLEGNFEKMLQRTEKESLGLLAGMVDGWREAQGQPYDLHLLCAGGRMVRSHTSVLGTLSRLFSSLLSSLPPSAPPSSPSPCPTSPRRPSRGCWSSTGRSGARQRSEGTWSSWPTCSPCPWSTLRSFRRRRRMLE